MLNTFSPEWASDTRQPVDGNETVTVWTRGGTHPVTQLSGDSVKVAMHQILTVCEGGGRVIVERSAERVLIGGLELAVDQAHELLAALTEVLGAASR